MIQHPTLTHIPQLQYIVALLPPTFQQHVHTLDIPMYHSTTVQVKYAHAHLPSIIPNVFLAEIHFPCDMFLY